MGQRVEIASRETKHESYYWTGHLPIKPMNRPLTVTLLLAALLAFCSEIVLWIDPPARSLVEWVLLVVGYVALAGLLIDIMARYRIGTFFGLIAVAGLYGLINSLILNPQMALIEMPRTLVTRVLGAHTLMGLLALAIFFGLLIGFSGRTRRLIMLIAVAALGFAWGGWSRWSGGAGGAVYEVTPELSLTPTAIALVFLCLIAAAWLFVRRAMADGSIPAPRVVDKAARYRLNRVGIVLMLAAFLLNLGYHLPRGDIDGISAVIIGILIAVVWVILWYQKRKKGAAVLESLDSVQREPPLYWLIAAVIFLLSGVLGHHLPRAAQTGDVIAWLSALFTAFGIVWLPALTLVIGARAWSRQARAMKL